VSVCLKISLDTCRRAIRRKKFSLRQLSHFFRADPAYGFGVAKALGIELSEDLALVSASTSDGELVAAEVSSSH
jgi:hypothetical protein